MTEVSTFRLYLLRGLYLLIGVGLGSMVWPGIIHHDASWPHMHGVAMALFGALSALALVGVRYPLQMLPLIFFEMLWKVIWLTAVAFPLWRANRLDPDNLGTVKDTAMVVIIPFIIPWGYVWANYVKKRSDRWGFARGGETKNIVIA